MPSPKISFLCPTYNHGRYVENFLRSLYAQTMSDWEIILVDDCSTDNNRDVILACGDSRVKLVCHSRNEGMTKSLQDAFRQSSAPIISWVASDDQLESNYVCTVVNSFITDAEAAVVYTPLRYMNADGLLTGDRSYLPVDKSRQQLFAEMFIGPNLLHSPGMAVRRDVFASLLPFDIGMIQLSDWQLHLRLLERCKPILLADPIVCYRLSRGSACARNRAVEFREDAEYHNLMDTALLSVGMSVARFKKYFSGYVEIVPQEDEDVPFVLGLVALHSPIEAKRRWGLRLMMNEMANEASAQRLYDRYGMDFSRLMRLSVEASQDENRNSEVPRPEMERLYRRLYRYKLAVVGLTVIGLIAVGIAICGG